MQKTLKIINDLSPGYSLVNNGRRLFIQCMSEQADQIELEFISALQHANRTSFTKDFLKQSLKIGEGELRDFLS